MWHALIEITQRASHNAERPTAHVIHAPQLSQCAARPLLRACIIPNCLVTMQFSAIRRLLEHTEQVNCSTLSLVLSGENRPIIARPQRARKIAQSPLQRLLQLDMNCVTRLALACTSPLAASGSWTGCARRVFFGQKLRLRLGNRGMHKRATARAKKRGQSGQPRVLPPAATSAPPPSTPPPPITWLVYQMQVKL